MYYGNFFRRSYFYDERGYYYDDFDVEQKCDTEAQKHCEHCGWPLVGPCPRCVKPLDRVPDEGAAHCRWCSINLLKVNPVYGKEITDLELVNPEEPQDLPALPSPSAR